VARIDAGEPSERRLRHGLLAHECEQAVANASPLILIVQGP
jgi:hypothetical protein